MRGSKNILLLASFKINKVKRYGGLLALGGLHLLQEPNFAVVASYFIGLLAFGRTSTKFWCCWFRFVLKPIFCYFLSILWSWNVTVSSDRWKNSMYCKSYSCEFELELVIVNYGLELLF